MAKPKLDFNNVADYRKKLGITQSAFWNELGVSQSGCSRYENGRDVPKPVALLLTLRESGKITAKDLADAKAAIAKAKSKK